MNKIGFLKKIGLSICANAISVGVSTILTFIIPKFWGVTDYGYWQLYLFYISYVGMFHFGIQDGVYLRYGGKKEQDIDIACVHSQFVFMILLEVVISSVIAVISYFNIDNAERSFIWYSFAICLVLYIPNTFIQYYLQAVGEVKEYSLALVIEKITLLSIIIIEMISTAFNFKLLISADLFAKSIGLIYIILCNKKIAFNKWNGWKKCIQEIESSLKAGFFLLISNLADSMIIGITRLVIENCWTIDIFAKTSFAISFSSFILIFIVAVGQIIFPELKSVDKVEMPMIYEKFDKVFIMVGMLLFCLYTPLQRLIIEWIPKYYESCYYFIFVIPICVFQSKSIMLLFTFYKLLREEKKLFSINIFGLALTACMVLISTTVFNDVNLVLLSATIGTGFRCIVLELYLSRQIPIKVVKSIIIESVLTALFICLYAFEIPRDYLIYLGVYLLTMYVFVKDKNRKRV